MEVFVLRELYNRGLSDLIPFFLLRKDTKIISIYQVFFGLFLN